MVEMFWPTFIWTKSKARLTLYELTLKKYLLTHITKSNRKAKFVSKHRNSILSDQLFQNLQNSCWYAMYAYCRFLDEKDPSVIAFVLQSIETYWL